MMPNMDLCTKDILKRKEAAPRKKEENNQLELKFDVTEISTLLRSALMESELEQYGSTPST